MSSYSYKGTPISTITDTTNASNTPLANYYSSFPTLSTSYSQLQPLPFDYTYSSNKVQVSNLCTAQTSYYYNSQNITCPTNATAMRILTIGGGGGGGGGGGWGKAYSNVTANGSGGAGGGGGFPGYSSTSTSNIIKVSTNSGIYVAVGGGGAGGTGGSNETSNDGNGANATGDDGVAGGSGGASYVTLTGDSTYYAYTNSLGNGGGGGQGGHGHTTSNGQTNTSTGASGNQGNSTSTQSAPSGWPSFAVNYGLPGNGGPENTAGNSGSSGMVQIVWLYE